MGKNKVVQPTAKYKNYSLPTSKPLKSHAFYEEKVWTLQEQIYKKLKKVAEFLENLYPKLTDDFSKNIKGVIKKNLEILTEDLDLMQHSLKENPDSFNTNKLKINQHRIAEMKNVCDDLQTVKSSEYEFKNLAKIRHVLNELDHLIQPTSFKSGSEKAPVKSKQKTVSEKKEPILVKAQKKKTISKKTKPATKSLKLKKIETKKPKKTSPKLKPTEKKVKVTKPKQKLPAENILKTKPKSKIKSSTKHKKK